MGCYREYMGCSRGYRGCSRATRLLKRVQGPLYRVKRWLFNSKNDVKIHFNKMLHFAVGVSLTAWHQHFHVFVFK